MVLEGSKPEKREANFNEDLHVLEKGQPGGVEGRGGADAQEQCALHTTNQPTSSNSQSAQSMSFVVMES